ILQLCADDFGLSEGIDRGILALIADGRLSATSCMVAGPALATHAGELMALADRADIGLHLTFTDLAPLGAMPGLMPGGVIPALSALIVRAFTLRLDYAEISAEIRRQIARFEAVFGRPPDFVDGHQHVHLLPVFRRALWACFDDGTLPATTAVRNCHEPAITIVRRGVEVNKTLFIAALSLGMPLAARRRGVPINDSFRGVTAFDPSRPYDFRPFLTGPGRRPLAMCHPGMPGFDPHPTDVIAAARQREYAYFSSDQFLGDLDRAGMCIGRHPRS
ncbi:MAG: ChbG/HpnK family deacetylase, partial [Ancalomicrobiaceae bacterium]|nr:ChbG/HpnK family deacetylase [Ancalomicrobiaceae bacterium]